MLQVVYTFTYTETLSWIHHHPDGEKTTHAHCGSSTFVPHCALWVSCAPWVGLFRVQANASRLSMATQVAHCIEEGVHWNKAAFMLLFFFNLLLSPSLSLSLFWALVVQRLHESKHSPAKLQGERKIWKNQILHSGDQKETLAAQPPRTTSFHKLAPQ